ncbi:Bacterial membrane protein YfhO [Bremerella volcania]|uniref:Bacterial membrane protein YfhO n=1 Tax=Bremerella volcania TaxID=2527984 RepID=A0A518C5N9_9BACT|nr:YfhO family protein [Bremerella volcania]QDU74522.1 Bacterial membrane protein YfhO [Bremerella volcania]
MNKDNAPPPVRSPALQRLKTCLGIALPFLILGGFFFGQAFVDQEHFVFRDAAHFYYPLFHEVTRQWKAGEVPLWSPYDGIGMPLAADGTSSVFYPFKAILLGPFDYDTGLRIYYVFHFLLAYAGTFVAARTWKCSLFGACLAASAYTFCGPTLSYTCNLVFLVGAAWLPWVLVAGWHVFNKPCPRSMSLLAVCLGMMVLGGDPQAAFHCMLLLCLGALFFAVPSAGLSDWKAWARQRSVRLAALLLAASFAGLLSAIQVLPTAQWSQRSDRLAAQTSTNAYQFTARWATGELTQRHWDDIRGIYPKTGHGRQSFDFSISPWLLPEVFCSNFSGKFYPQRQRWAQILPGEGRIWFPALFVGTLTVLCAVVGFRCRSRGGIDQFMLAMTLFGLLACFGWYGLGWIVGEVSYFFNGPTTDDLPVGSPFGGLYWFLVVFVPKYAAFRYPAKWYIVFCFGISILAGRGLPRAIRLSATSKRRLLMLAISSLLLGAAIYLNAAWISTTLPTEPPDDLFGPLDALAGIRDMAQGIFQMAAVILLTLLIVGYAPKQWRPGLLVGLLIVDMALANAWVAPTAPQEVWKQNTAANVLPKSTSDDPLPGVYRTRNLHFYPTSFDLKGSDDRQREGLAIDRENLYPRYQLIQNVRLAPSITSIFPTDYQLVISEAYSPQNRPLVLNLLGTRKIWDYGPDKVRVSTNNPDAWPAAWWRPNATWIEAPDNTIPSQASATEQILEELRRNSSSPGGVLEGNPGEHANDAQTAEDIRSVEVLCQRPRAGSIQIELKDAQPGWLFIREYFDDGWTCQVTQADGIVRPAIPIYRANRIMMAVPVEAGDTKVTLTYWPRSFVIGAVVSGLSWLALIVLFAAKGVWAAFGRR